VKIAESEIGGIKRTGPSDNSVLYVPGKKGMGWCNLKSTTYVSVSALGCMTYIDTGALHGANVLIGDECWKWERGGALS
jgi:hypothetical protein